MTISALIPVHNEEKRIEYTLRCAVWCDEIVILDKQSTDRTCDICKQYTNNITVLSETEYNPLEIETLLSHCNSEWVLFLTASDVIHPKLCHQIRDLIHRANFPYDVIHVPFKRYILGLDHKRSPWHTVLQSVVVRKNVVRVKKDSVHGALFLDTTLDRHYKMAFSEEWCMYHLSHESVDVMMDRHIRYWMAEAKMFPPDRPLKRAFNPILRSAFDVVFRLKTWLMGWDGIALAIAFMSYWMLQFVYVWERRHCQAPETYRNIRSSVLQAWEQYDATKRD
jgi:glycosyltransferase involved in cell wall biosynthesis